MDLPKSLEVRRLPTLLAGLFLLWAWALNEVVLAWVHDHVPRKTAPLPDAFFRLFPEVPWVMRAAEYSMLCIAGSSITVMCLHQHRWVVLRRTFFCAALCYTFRALCIVLLQHTYCAPQQPSSVHSILRRVADMFWAAGIEQLRPRVLCGDLIVSGHTVTIFTALLAFRQYAPRRLLLLGYLYQALALLAVCCILLARKHYSLDVLLAYLATTRTFWTYHSLASSFHDGGFDRNPMNQTCWAGCVRVLERDAPPPHLFLNVLQWPSSCPQRIRRRLAI